MREHLELPRPLRLLRTALWSLTASAGLPMGAAALGAWLYGRDVGLLAGLIATWLTAPAGRSTWAIEAMASAGESTYSSTL